MCTKGPEDPELASITFVMATAAQAPEVEILAGYQGNGVLLAKKDVAEGVFAPVFPPLKQLLDTYIEMRGKVYCCGPCIKAREINPESDLISGVSLVNAATFVKEATEATNVLVY